MRTREPTLLHTPDGTLPEALLESINLRGFGDPCKEAIIFLIRPTNGEAVLAFLGVVFALVDRPRPVQSFRRGA